METFEIRPMKNLKYLSISQQSETSGSICQVVALACVRPHTYIYPVVAYAACSCVRLLGTPRGRRQTPLPLCKSCNRSKVGMVLCAAKFNVCTGGETRSSDPIGFGSPRISGRRDSFSTKYPSTERPNLKTRFVFCKFLHNPSVNQCNAPLNLSRRKKQSNVFFCFVFSQKYMSPNQAETRNPLCS